MSVSYHHLFKILLVGDSGVGKSALLLRFADDAFNESCPSTIGIDFKSRIVQVNGQPVKLQVWDAAGQERFRSLSTAYYRGAHGVIIVYDVTSMESFSNVKKWLDEVGHMAAANVTVFLIGAKIDLAANQVVDSRAARELADTVGITFIETSAKTGFNVDQAFLNIATDIQGKVMHSAGNKVTVDAVVAPAAMM